MDWWLRHSGQSLQQAEAERCDAELLEELHVFLRNRLSVLDQARQTLQARGGLAAGGEAVSELQKLLTASREIQAFLGGAEKPEEPEAKLVEELRKEWENRRKG